LGGPDLEELLTMIDDIQGSVFDYQLKRLSELIIQLVEKLMVLASSLPTDKQVAMNKVLTAILNSYENKDYLLMADLLEYELKPLLAAN
jgi:hypothetical protein